MDTDFIYDPFDELGIGLDVPFVPSDERVVKAMLEMGAVEADDVLYDLGSGDGRIVVAAAQECGARAVGIEKDPSMIITAEAYAAQMGVEHQVCFVQDDLFEGDISPATVVTLYLLHTINLELRPRLLSELRPGTRVVSHAFDMGDWKPDRRARLRGSSIYLWVIPARVAGRWEWESPAGSRYRVALEQTYQRLQGQAWVDDQPAQLQVATLWGDLMELQIQPEGDREAESIVLHCQEQQLVVVSEHQRGAIAHAA
ncbi:MAG: class I SAM-dependent methyltransferase [Spongiibacteraceae bacterium]|nr:class I SAM-dependent methyltransferase [Spongiibacteraceae bacterium]